MPSFSLFPFTAGSPVDIWDYCVRRRSCAWHCRRYWPGYPTLFFPQSESARGNTYSCGWSYRFSARALSWNSSTGITRASGCTRKASGFELKNRSLALAFCSAFHAPKRKTRARREVYSNLPIHSGHAHGPRKAKQDVGAVSGIHASGRFDNDAEGIPLWTANPVLIPTCRDSERDFPFAARGSTLVIQRRRPNDKLSASRT